MHTTDSMADAAASFSSEDILLAVERASKDAADAQEIMTEEKAVYLFVIYTVGQHTCSDNINITRHLIVLNRSQSPSG